MPRQVNPNKPKRTAHAPYNFVPLPEAVFTVKDGIEVEGTRIKPWEQHDRFIKGTQSGWLELEIEALTPLFIRGAPRRTDNGQWDTREARLRPDSHQTFDGVPAIPGSSLRGMVRSLVEILAFAKIQPVSREKPFFRTVAPDRMGKQYAAKLRQGNGVQGGILQQGANGDWEIRPCEVLRIQQNKIGGNTHSSGYPQWKYQHRRCWVQHDRENVQKLCLEDPKSDAWSPATIVLTGQVSEEKREFVFLTPAKECTPIPVSEQIWNRFHDVEQITQWQEKAFPTDKPQGSSRRAKGHLRDGEPVFFVLREEGLAFLGRAGMFRFPYDLSPADLVPKRLCEAGLDLAEVMFGCVSKNGAIKGRVFFEDAIAVTSDTTESYEETIVPRILSSPKVTTFQHYLTQNGKAGKTELTSYINGDHTTLRGHKLYWHRWDEAKGLSQIKESDGHERKLQDLLEGNNNDTSPKQHTVIRPIKAGVRFSGRIRFENLTDIELGVLLSALQLPAGCAHKLGMGKPLGLGSVRIETRLFVVDRQERYSAWAPTGVAARDGSREREAFADAILEHTRASNETMIEDIDGLWGIARLDALLQMLQWVDRPHDSQTNYQSLKEFRDRPVLPTPHAVVGRVEPNWPTDEPFASPDIKPALLSQRDGVCLPVVNDKVRAILTERRTKMRGGKVSWRAKHCDSGLTGPLVNSKDVPADKKEGDEVCLFVCSLGCGPQPEVSFSWPTEEEEKRVAKGKNKSSRRRRRRP